ncbi:hypothetical protein CTI14_65980 [Methylobacterium radiotolerans]|nr:hypothetical protein CTI14_65980 [Methylobacterium radiotolerans]
MLRLSLVIGVVSSAAGYALALWLDTSIAGMIASVLGVVFTLSQPHTCSPGSSAACCACPW